MGIFAPLPAVPSSWTPTWTSLTVGNGTVSAEYSIVGPWVFCAVRFTMGSTSSISGDVKATLPVPASSRYSGTTQHGVGNGYIEDSGVAGYHGYCKLDGTTTVNFQAVNASTTLASQSLFSSTSPFTWGTGDFFGFTFSFIKA